MSGNVSGNVWICSGCFDKHNPINSNNNKITGSYWLLYPFKEFTITVSQRILLRTAHQDPHDLSINLFRALSSLFYNPGRMCTTEQNWGLKGREDAASPGNTEVVTNHKEENTIYIHARWQSALQHRVLLIYFLIKLYRLIYFIFLQISMIFGLRRRL